MPGPAATIGSNHVCPMCTGTTPHVGGPISGPGVPTVLIGGKPASVMGDMCVCVGPPDTVVMGVSNVLIGGKPAVTLGDMTAHGGSIVVGDPTVLIGTSQAVPSTVMPIKNIPFPEITTSDRMAASRAGHDLTEAENNQNAIKEAANNSEKQQGEPKVFNLQWLKEEIVIRGTKVAKKVTLQADVQNIDDGETISFKIKRSKSETDDNLVELTGKVKNGKSIITWEVEEQLLTNKNNQDG